ncbi:uncharacterized protein MONOS_18674 [Monocercomonoides exilis]|uniref:uncharacterized protein n=1 Tax=Monocercomonoides exilis TaxID=2049356 RepID=UPI00355A5FD2|nr:hypothetical protein MONOS_18674 [Monocercomonoides exilis]
MTRLRSEIDVCKTMDKIKSIHRKLTENEQNVAFSKFSRELKKQIDDFQKKKNEYLFKRLQNSSTVINKIFLRCKVQSDELPRFYSARPYKSVVLSPRSVQEQSSQTFNRIKQKMCEDQKQSIFLHLSDKEDQTTYQHLVNSHASINTQQFPSSQTQIKSQRTTFNPSSQCLIRTNQFQYYHPQPVNSYMKLAPSFSVPKF